MSFGKTFHTLKEANAYAKQKNERTTLKVEVRKLRKKLYPRRKKLFHVGTYLDWLNFG